MPNTEFNHYQKEQSRGTLPAFIPISSDKDPYFPSDELVAAINVAIALGQPLLLTGEPGTGKTQLAHHLAKYFNLNGPLIFNAQTNSVKKDLFYSYDALGHFHYTHTDGTLLDGGQVEDKFIRYEALGEAINVAMSLEAPKRSIVLIDEIDKAPRDLPNDLLAAIENLSFDVPEIPGKNKPKECPKKLTPLIIITSNSEKNLPDAFLRRVVYHHIEFPEDSILIQILENKTNNALDQTSVQSLITHFKKIREEKNLEKRPATAELISWVFILRKISFPIEKLNNIDDLNPKETKLLHISYSVIAKNQDDLKKLTQAKK